MSVTLISLEGREDIPLDRVLTVVGRHHCCDARIDSSRVSRRHCCLALDSEGVLVRELGSTNGTRVNGIRVEDGLLRPGDELTIAYSRYRLVIRDDPAAAGPPPTEAGVPPCPRPDRPSQHAETLVADASESANPPSRDGTARRDCSLS